ncbi:GerAB/ArcD/ProY family transporter [Neobacillus niacini]|uniref:GerAB/ArcD/ProY family transporter n=1 Tax=Neobacillus niacini TaxID=86668 RepID=UPI002FFE0EA5
MYLVILNMLTNVIIFVPKYLIQYRFDGLILSMLLATVIGIGLMYLDTIVYARFPGQGLPEILDLGLNKPLKIFVLVGFSFFWFIAGLISLLGYIDILHRIINPELSKVWLLVAFLVVLGFVIQLPTRKVMYLLEIILLLNVPFIGFVFIKALTSDYLNWDSIFEVVTHAATVPKLNPVAIASYVFSGYANIIVFNRLLKEKIKSINFVIIFFVSLLTLFTSVFIPIGMHGSDGVQEYIYPWIMTADSLRLPYSPVERVVFLFLMLYINITLISVSVHWHVAFELMKGVYKSKKSKTNNRLLMAFFFGLSILAVLRFDFMHPELISMYWLIARFFVEIIAIIGFFFFLRRKI